VSAKLRVALTNIGRRFASFVSACLLAGLAGRRRYVNVQCAKGPEMKIARIFLNPDGSMWFDTRLRPDQDCSVVFQTLRGEGAIVHPMFIVPTASVHHVSLIIAPDQPDTQEPTFIIPGEGKPN
jgi:hypothetical protein